MNISFEHAALVPTHVKPYSPNARLPCVVFFNILTFLCTSQATAPSIHATSSRRLGAVLVSQPICIHSPHRPVHQQSTPCSHLLPGMSTDKSQTTFEAITSKLASLSSGDDKDKKPDDAQSSTNAEPQKDEAKKDEDAQGKKALERMDHVLFLTHGCRVDAARI